MYIYIYIYTYKKYTLNSKLLDFRFFARFIQNTPKTSQRLSVFRRGWSNRGGLCFVMRPTARNGDCCLGGGPAETIVEGP